MTVVRFRSDWIGPSGPTRRHCAMFNQSNPRLWFLGIVLTGLFPIESLDLECWRLGGHWQAASPFRRKSWCFLRVRQGFL